MRKRQSPFETIHRSALRRRIEIVAAACLTCATVAKAQTYAIQQIGLIDAAHTGSGGYTNNTPIALNAAGQVTGHAHRYIDGTYEGEDAWLYFPTTNMTQLIGLTDSAHTLTDGYSFNTPIALNAAGQIVGYAYNYINGFHEGQDDWFYDPATNTTREIGLTDSAHIPTGGTSSNSLSALNAAGQVAGYAGRYNGSTFEGDDVWLYTPATHTTQVIGLTDSAHTQTGGYMDNRPLTMNAIGQITGFAERFSGNAGEGQDAWLYSPTTNTTHVIGLTDSAHTQTGGNSTNNPTTLNSAGLVTGFAERFSGNIDEGQDAWLYSPITNTAQVIGLTDSTHTQTGGYSTNNPTALNAVGQVAGDAERYSGSTDKGVDAWLYSPTTNTTQLIGLVDSTHIQTGGHSENFPIALNAVGQVAGSAERYDGDIDEGQDVWLYDSASQTTFDLVSSPSAFGFGYSQVEYLGDDGVVMGWYDVDGGSTQDVFLWTESRGFHDLGTLVQGGLTAADWANLAQAFGAIGTADIVGYGTTLGASGQQAFELTPVPEPAPLAAIALTAACALGHRRRRV